MKRPSFQFYPADWTASPNLRRCSFAEKGIWLEVLCLMHDQPEYGVLRWPLAEIAEAVKCKVSDLQALQRKGVLKGSDTLLEDAFVYVPRSGRKDGEPVTLVAPQDGPIWYSSRMVKDEYVSTKRAEASGNGDPDGATPKQTPKATPQPSPKGGIGVAFGPRDAGTRAAPSSSSSPSGVIPPVVPQGGPEGRPEVPCPYDRIVRLYHELLPSLPKAKLMPAARQRAMRKLWGWVLSSTKGDGTRRATNADEALHWLAGYFGRAAENDFLMGRTPRSAEHANWRCDIDFLMTERGMKQVIERTQDAA